MTDGFKGDKKVGQSLLHAAEERLKGWLLPLVPKRVETYHLTLTTVLWSLLIIVFSFLSQTDVRWMWMASLMIVCQYITDLLDGAIGRQRDTGLVKWGYYMDHFLDYIFLCSILVGYSLLIQDHNKYMLFFIISLFGAFMVNSFLAFAATNEFKIAYLGIGPTEIRIVFIVINTLLIFADGHVRFEFALPYVLWFSTFGLFVTVYKTQEEIWTLDMEKKHGSLPTKESNGDLYSVIHQEWSLYLSKRQIVRYWGLSFLMVFIAFAVLMMRLFSPYDRKIAGFIFLISWGPFLLSFKGKSAILRERGNQIRKVLFPNLPYIIVAIVLMFSAMTAHVLIPMEDTQLRSLTSADLKVSLHDDMKRIQILRSNMKSLLTWIDQKGLLSKPVDKLSPEQKTQLKRLWNQYINITLELEFLKSRYKGFYQIDRIAQRQQHADAFFLQYSALVTQYSSSQFMVDVVDKNEFMATVLNEADDTYLIPKNSYDSLKKRLSSPSVLLKLNAWAVYLQMVKKDLEEKNQMFAEIETEVEDIYKTIGQRPSVLITNPADYFERRAFDVWFPFQKEVATQMGRIRIEPRESFISQDFIKPYRDKLEPGDLVLERKNWMMSNAGIPGFWPHIAIYVGYPEELDSYFKGIPMLGKKKASDYIRKKRPDAYKAWIAPDKNGFKRCIIEALEDGSVFTSSEQSLNADYLAVLRPKMSKEDKFKALLESLKYHGKPYDFNFDFATDNELVCTELVYKGYQVTESLTLKQEVLNGRLLITPNYFAEKFASEYETDKQELDFVMFIDASEKTGEVVLSDVETFLETWKRSKWEIMLE